MARLPGGHSSADFGVSRAHLPPDRKAVLPRPAHDPNVGAVPHAWATVPHMATWGPPATVVAELAPSRFCQ